MIGDQDLAGTKIALDTPPLYHFSLAERLDVLQDLLLDDDCWTIVVVIGELKERAAEAGQPLLLNAVGLEWLQVATLNEDMKEMRSYLRWVGLVGQQERNLGEASVFAAAELFNCVAITDDGDARRVAKKHGIKVHGTIWLLARACRQQKMTEVAASSVINSLRQTGHRLPCTGDEFPMYARKNDLL